MNIIVFGTHRMNDCWIKRMSYCAFWVLRHCIGDILSTKLATRAHSIYDIFDKITCLDPIDFGMERVHCDCFCWLVILKLISCHRTVYITHVDSFRRCPNARNYWFILAWNWKRTVGLSIENFRTLNFVNIVSAMKNKTCLIQKLEMCHFEFRRCHLDTAL